MLIEKSMDSLDRIKKLADCFVVVQRVDNVGNVLTHIYLNVPILSVKLGAAVNEVSGKYLINNSVSVCLIELIKAVGEETEGSEGKYSLSASFLYLCCNRKYSLSFHSSRLPQLSPFADKPNKECGLRVKLK